MRILIANDDGIYSPGILALAQVASRFGDVVIVAPDVEQSSMSHAITHSRPLSYRRTPVIKGFPAYRVSKTALNALTRIAAAEAARGDVKVNACSPGWVRTDMGGADAPRTPEKGAETAVWLATLPTGGPTGGFFQDKAPIPW